MKKLKLKKRNYRRSDDYKIEYAEQLNQEQHKAVMHNNGPALVIAGAGSGKTRTLVYRVARLIEDGVDPRSILLLTFTRKASNEMKLRAANLLDSRAEAIGGGTFHSFALQTLKRNCNHIGFSKHFGVIDQQDAADTINLVRLEHIPSKLKKRFPKKNTLYTIFSLSINKKETIGDILKEKYPNYLEYEDKINSIFLDYTKYKKSANVMDYDDLLLYLYELLKENEEVRNKINSEYKYIMVDEYQDTNRLQHELVLLLGGESNNIMAVGDDAQSIYSFRGADYQNIFFFPESFEKCDIYKIEQNYRSTEQILDLTNQIINSADFKYEKKLFTKDRIGNTPYLVAAKKERQQSAFVVQQILELREDGIELEDIAVLFRSSYHAFDLEIEMNRSNIPYVKFGGMKFTETAHIKDLIAYLKLCFNPKDVVSWQRVLLLIEGVGPVTTRKINDAITNNKLSLENFRKVLPTIKEDSLLLELFGNINKYFDTDDLTNAASELAFFYKQFMDLKYDNEGKRWRDIETFLQIVEQYNDLPSFLNDMALDPPVSSLEDMEPESQEDEYITLSTIHSAKGLEWKVVFIVWATEGKFPSAKSVHSIDSIEEERRLFYVAATRAQDQLYIVYPYGIYDREAGMFLSESSRFIRDIDEKYLDKYILTEEDED